MRHQVTIRRLPAGEPALDSRGQPNAAPVDVLTAVPCRITPTVAAETESGRKLTQVGSYEVEFWGEPGTEITTACWLITDDNKRLNIASINADQLGNETFYTLACLREVT